MAKRSIMPITPDEVAKARTEQLPEGVLAAWNELITSHWDGESAIILQSHAVAAIMEKMDCPARESVFANRWLDIEGVYRQAGWVVVYDKPAYNEDYKASFTFRRR